MIYWVAPIDVCHIRVSIFLLLYLGNIQYLYKKTDSRLDKGIYSSNTLLLVSKVNEYNHTENKAPVKFTPHFQKNCFINGCEPQLPSVIKLQEQD